MKHITYIFLAVVLLGASHIGFAKPVSSDLKKCISTSKEEEVLFYSCVTGMGGSALMCTEAGKLLCCKASGVCEAMDRTKRPGPNLPRPAGPTPPAEVTTPPTRPGPVRPTAPVPPKAAPKQTAPSQTTPIK